MCLANFNSWEAVVKTLLACFLVLLQIWKVAAIEEKLHVSHPILSAPCCCSFFGLIFLHLLVSFHFVGFWVINHFQLNKDICCLVLFPVLGVCLCFSPWHFHSSLRLLHPSGFSPPPSSSTSLSVSCPWWGNDGTYVDNRSASSGFNIWLCLYSRIWIWDSLLLDVQYMLEMDEAEWAACVGAGAVGVCTYYVDFVAKYNQCLINVPHWNAFILLS